MTTSPEAGRFSLLKRVVVGIVFAPLLVWIFWKGGYPFFVFLVFLTAFGQWELYRMFTHRLRFPHRAAGFTAGLLIVMSAFFGYFEFISGIVVLSLICSFLIEIVSGKEHRLEAAALSLFVTVYPALFIIFLVRISGLRYNAGFAVGQYTLLYILLVIWTFDTMSYFAGRSFGSRSFFPSISPKKTVEGFVGGLAGVVILSVAAGILAGRQYAVHIAVLSLLVAIAGQAGDLAESLIKRDMGVKDSSGIIPGHGGILDRFDSLLFAGPVAYAYISVVFRVTGGHS